MCNQGEQLSINAAFVLVVLQGYLPTVVNSRGCSNKTRCCKNPPNQHLDQLRISPTNIVLVQ